LTGYFLLKNLHIGLALISGLGFALRGYLRLVLDRPYPGPLVRIGPHIIDTLLLISGIGLWMQTRHGLLSWMGLKLVLILVYILMGVGALRSKSRGTGIMLYWLALGVFLSIAIIAIEKPM